jgi:DNA primase
MFPIADRRGRVIAFGGRILDQGEPKYLNSPETALFHKGRTLYGQAQAARAARESGEIVVCEGYMDVIALAEAGFAGAVAPLGTALTEGQIAELWRLAPEPILCFDGDAAGQRAAARAVERALPLLQPGKSLRFAVLPPGEDPDTLIRARGPAAMREVLAEARPLIDLPGTRAGECTDTPGGGPARPRPGPIRLIAERPFTRLSGRGGRRLARHPGAANSPRSPSPPEGRPGAVEIGGMAARAGTKGLERQPEEVVLALLVNHPELAAAHGEELAQANFRAGGLDKLRQAIIDLAAGHPDLDSETVKLHLDKMGFAQALQGLLDRTKDKRFTLPTAPAERAAEGLREQLGLMRERAAVLERDMAARRLGEEPSDDAFARFETARQATLEGESRRADVDGVDAGATRVRST